MTTPPTAPKIYHITHIDNLASIAGCGALWSDAQRIKQGFGSTNVGINNIKTRRLAMPVGCNAGTCVGDYVPFNFCPRSVMLYILHMGNHPELTYTGGQRPIVHLQADFHSVVAWAQAKGLPWAISRSNAGAFYTPFFNMVADLPQLDWNAIINPDFRATSVKEGKQAEFLMYDWFPWSLVEKIGVLETSMAAGVKTQLAGVAHLPPVSVERGWYY